jgi:PAS domain S-box-containing protein
MTKENSQGSDTTIPLLEELEALRHRLLELEEIEVMRVSEEQERFDSLQVLDEYAKQLEESRDKLTRLLRAGTGVQEAQTVQEVLQKIADSVGEAGWGSVSVSLFENWDITESAYFGVSQEDIEFLRAHRRPPQERARFYGPDFERFRVSRSYFVPGEMLPQVMSIDGIVPGRRTVQCGDTWDPMDLAYVPLYGSDGKVIGTINCDDPTDGQRPTAETFFYLELFADLAARKVETQQLFERQSHIEDALRDSEERYRTMFNGSSDAFYVMDEIFHDCNTQACELWRCTRDDIVGHSPIEFSPEYQPDGRTSQEAALDFIHKAMAGVPQRFYWLHRRKDGDLVDCEVSLARIQLRDNLLVLAVVRDISTERRSEEERKRLALLVENSSDYIAIITTGGDVAYLNDAGLKMAGLKSLADAQSQRFEEHFSPSDKTDMLQLALSTVQRLGHWEGELLLRNFDAETEIPTQVHMFAIRDASGNRISAIGAIARDLSYIKQAESASRRSGEALRWLVENLDDPIGMTDINERFLYANTALAALFGLRNEELIGRSLEEFVDAKTFDFVREQTELRRAGERNRYQVEIRRADGEYRLVEIIATPQFDREGNLCYVVAAVHDISHQEFADQHSSPH